MAKHASGGLQPLRPLAQRLFLRHGLLDQLHIRAANRLPFSLEVGIRQIVQREAPQQRNALGTIGQQPLLNGRAELIQPLGGGCQCLYPLPGLLRFSLRFRFTLSLGLFRRHLGRFRLRLGRLSRLGLRFRHTLEGVVK